MGWARANLIYETLTGPPTPGTPMESLMLIVWRMRQDIRMNETRVIIQSILAAAPEAGEQAGKSMQEAWKDYTEEIFPFQRGQRRGADDAAITYLKREAARGPLKVTPLQGLSKGKSRLKRRQAEVAEKRTVVRRMGRKRR